MISKAGFVEALCSKLAKAEAAFRMVDTDNSGVIDYLELESLLQQLFPTFGKKERKKYHVAIVKECDKSGEGKIDLDEFIFSQYADLLAEPAEFELRQRKRAALLEDLFQQFDREQKGFLSRDQMRTLVLQTFPDYSLREQNAFFEVICTDCDKQGDGKVSLSRLIDSEYANTLLGNAYEEPLKRSMKRPAIILDQDALKAARRELREQKKAKSLRLSDMGSATKDQNVLLSASEAAKARREQREAAVKAEKQVTQGHAIALVMLKAREEEVNRLKSLDARDVMRKGAQSQHLGYVPGILEKERRFSLIRDIFDRWDNSSDVSRDSSGFIEYEELRGVLKRFYNWTDEEADVNADGIMRKMDADLSGTLDFNEFSAFIEDLTRRVSPQQFDNLLHFLGAAVADFSQDQEHDRRLKLLTELFALWDYDKTGLIDQGEVYRVMTRFNDSQAESKGEDFAALLFECADANNDGTLDKTEFVQFFDNLTFDFKPEEFDFVLYRLHRCLEEIQVLLEDNSASLKYRAVLLNALERHEIDQLLEGSSATSPIVCYGTAFDPARAIEQYAKAQRIVVKPFLVTHERAARLALEGLRRYGFRAGHWVYIVFGKDYPCDSLLRQIGLDLQTRNDAIHPQMRLWITYPQKDCKNLPGIVTCHARVMSLDTIDPPDQLLTAKDREKKARIQTGRTYYVYD
eukprot:TRINITY_DN16362_c0_g1_i4.p1 TRINITY_DN16362_c0_g1~~TRINITY_DN16362_c0_g1_i4.p1  ORF type:complete len:689 (+),score=119.68 TRINITY_DN16362_c0_g1_i4:2535-4601(+)